MRFKAKVLGYFNFYSYKIWLSDVKFFVFKIHRIQINESLENDIQIYVTEKFTFKKYEYEKMIFYFFIKKFK